MQTPTERRVEPKRIVIEKKIELVSLDGAKIVSGRTGNMSDSGLSARFEALPEMGSDVRLRVFWDASQDPIEQDASIVWRSKPDDNSGACMGFQLKVGELEPSPRARKKPRLIDRGFNKASAAEAESSPIIIEKGSPVWLQKGGVAIEAEVEAIGDIDADNGVNVMLRITDPAFCDPGALAGRNRLSDELQDFTNHPFRDAFQLIKRYAGPTALVLYQYGIKCAKWARVRILALVAKARDSR
jgi:hypothetical protein